MTNLLPLGANLGHRGTTVEEIGWEMAVQIAKIIVAVLHEAHKRQIEETMEDRTTKGTASV